MFSTQMTQISSHFFSQRRKDAETQRFKHYLSASLHLCVFARKCVICVLKK